MKTSWELALTAAIAATLVAGAPAQAETARAMLSDGDCAKCHEAPPADLTAAGGKHLEVNCTGCHEGHRPAVKSNIPACKQCHDGSDHFKLANCGGCHKNPHKPLDIVLAKGIVEPCLTCHTDQIAQLRENKSKHSALSCTQCHSKHREAPSCTQCHKPHGADMGAADCKACHKAHMPKVVRYADIGNKLCASCHRKALEPLTASTAKHRSFSCTYCHKTQHKSVPKCQECHPNKHPDAILARFPRCGECHNVAHDLNNWAKGAKAGGKVKTADTQ